MLEVGYELGSDRILLWLPWIAKHVIDEDSPLSAWLTPSGFMADADSCIAVVAEAYQYMNSQNRMRMRIYNVLEDVKRQHAFESIVSSPLDSPDYKPRVDWVRFHTTRPLPGAVENRRPAMPPQMRSTDSTLAVTTFKHPRRESVSLSKISFVPEHNSPPISHLPRPASGDVRQSNGEEVPPPSISQADEGGFRHEEDGHSEHSEGGSFLHGHRSHPPESSATMLTPFNDSENTFIQRPTPPIAEGDEENYTGRSRGSSLGVSSLGALARSSAQSLRNTFSRDMDR